MRSAIIVVTLLLAACGQGPQQEEEAAAKADIAIRGLGPGTVAPPTNLPSFAPIFPGGRVTTTVQNGQEADKGMVTFHVDGERAADIVGFYKQKGEAVGLSAAMESAAGDARVLMMNDASAADSDTARGIQVTAASDGEGGTSVTLAYTGSDKGQ